MNEGKYDIFLSSFLMLSYLVYYFERFLLLPPFFYAKYMHDFKHTDFMRMNHFKRRENEKSREISIITAFICLRSSFTWCWLLYHEYSMADFEKIQGKIKFSEKKREMNVFVVQARDVFISVINIRIIDNHSIFTHENR